ncbi:MAG TPA: aminotransferase class V-fold PLP-dependent enzyme [Candidatus Angelobacter sp.]|nr:aminotransferase class V-fold PLP-dependent enzyme [Candidatus Angelobacter sp.]
MGFDLDFELRQKLGYSLIDHINEYFSSLSDRPVQLPREQRSFAALGGQMPELGEDPVSVLNGVTAQMVQRGFHVPSANYFGLMNPTPTYVAVLAEALVATLNPQLASHSRSQLASKIEAETVRWIGEQVGWSGAFDGTFTSGGNEANFTALALALAHRFPNSVEDGVASIGARPVVYASSESHHSLDKSAGLLGLGRRALRRIPVTEKLQLDVRKLESQIKQDQAAGFLPLCVAATAGATSSGAIDDLPTLAEVCKRNNLWFHVDGAYGAAVIFSRQHRDLVRGIELADSITIDPHKWLAMPFAAGVILTSHPETLQNAFGVSTPYMPKADANAPVDNFKMGAQWSRRMNSLKLWITLRVHGRQAYEDLIHNQLELARSFADWVRDSGQFELASPQVLPIVNLRLSLPGATEEEIRADHEAIVEATTREGRRWISTTIVNGKSVLRVMVISYLTEPRHLDELKIALTEAVSQTRAVHNRR